jgi:hypothetical protein
MSALTPKADIDRRHSNVCLMSALCHQQTLPALFDHLIGMREHGRRNGRATRLGGLEVDDELLSVQELGKIGRGYHLPAL